MVVLVLDWGDLRLCVFVVSLSSCWESSLSGLRGFLGVVGVLVLGGVWLWDLVELSTLSWSFELGFCAVSLSSEESELSVWIFVRVNNGARPSSRSEGVILGFTFPRNKKRDL